MSTLEPITIDDVSYEVEPVSAIEGFKAACACPKCKWASVSAGYDSLAKASAAVREQVRTHHARHHAHAMA